MASARALNLDLSFPSLNSPKPLTIPLGSVVERRGTIDVDEVIYPRLTGFYFEIPALDITLDPLLSAEPFFRDPPTGRDFVTEGNTFLLNNGVIFPFPGVYRVRMNLAYSMVTPGQSTEVDLTILNQQSHRATSGDSGIFVYDRIVPNLADVSTVIITNIGPGSIRLRGSYEVTADTQTFIEATYLGQI